MYGARPSFHELMLITNNSYVFGSEPPGYIIYIYDSHSLGCPHYPGSRMIIPRISRYLHSGKTRRLFNPSELLRLLNAPLVSPPRKQEKASMKDDDGEQPI